jgi:DNA-binding GntR family transcriptional regulator
MKPRNLQRDKIFEYICEFKRLHHGTSPTYVQVAEEFTISPDTARTHCTWLAAEGKLQLIPHIGIVVPDSEWELIAGGD